MSIVEKALKATAASDTLTDRSRATRETRSSDRPERSPAHAPVSIEALREKNLSLRPEDSPQAREQIRRLKRPLLQNAFGQLAAPFGNLAMISSPNPGSGKTFLAIHLAQALCVDRERSVVLVDCDNTKASITKGFGLGEARGLFDVLNESGKAALDSLIVPTDVPGLSVIPTGARYSDSDELMATGRAAQAFRELATRDSARIVLLDCPPLLASPDAITLATLAGQILLVIGAGTTDRESIQRSAELLSDMDKPIGVVLNQAPLSAWLPDYQRYGYGDY